MALSSSPRDLRTLVAAASLFTGPLLMSIGDLLHPEERMDPSEQIAILVGQASRWYTAHLLLFIGMMLFIPGLLPLGRAHRCAQAGGRLCGTDPHCSRGRCHQRDLRG